MKDFILPNNLVRLSRGSIYPHPIARTEGAAAQFLTTAGHILQVGMSGLMRSEIMAIRNEPIDAGFVCDGPMILWVFTFGTIILECPFDARLIPHELRQLPDIGNDRQRLLIEVHLVDLATSVLGAIRFVTLPAELTRRFLSAVQEQLADTRDIASYCTRYDLMSPQSMPGLAKVERCGR